MNDAFRKGTLKAFASDLLSDKFVRELEDHFVEDVRKVISDPNVRNADPTYREFHTRLEHIKSLAAIGYRFHLGDRTKADDSIAIRRWRRILERAAFDGYDLQIENLEDMDEPGEFQWTTDLNLTTIEPPLKDTTRVNACGCTSGCGATCACQPKYGANGKLRAGTKTIIECSSECLCDVTVCGNRTVMKGKIPPLCIFKTNNRGWGVKSRTFIERGTFLGTYAGHVYRKKDIPNNLIVTDPHRNAYLFETEFKGTVKFVVDASKSGNFTRFFNHSCSPNMDVVQVIMPIETGLRRIAFFAAEDIAENVELTFEYCVGNSRACLCGSQSCRGTF